MFERYNEEARRVIYFSRWEALRSNSTCIEPEHMLLGLTHDADSTANQLFALSACTENFRSLLGVHPSRESSTWGDILLSNSGRRVVAYAAEEADRLASAPIGTEHLLLGLLREKDSDVPKVLAKIGIDLRPARNLIRSAQASAMPGARPADKQTFLRLLRPFAAFFLLVAVLSLFYLLVRLANS